MWLLKWILTRFGISVTISLPSFYTEETMGEQDFWREIHNYKSSEFDSPDLPGSGQYMDPVVVYACDRASDHYKAVTGKVLDITSAARSETHNKRVGGVKESSHTLNAKTRTYGAVDIGTPDSFARWCVLEAAMYWGLTRIGIGENFIHIDKDELRKPPKVVWHYYKKKKR